MILESRGGWTEAVTYLFLLRGSYAMTILRYLERFAHNDAERFIYGRVIQDRARHMAYAPRSPEVLPRARRRPGPGHGDAAVHR